MHKKSSINRKDFIKWVREVINTQADKFHSNSVSLGDYSKDGNEEYSYPKEFIVNEDKYSWECGSWHTKRKLLSSHNEIWFHGTAFNPHDKRIATGELTKYKIWKGLKIIYSFYYPEGRN